jgi:cytochrome c biogenesis protein
VKTTLALVLLMAALSVAGTLLPPEAAARYYRNPVSASLLVLFSLNIALCTWHRSSRAIRGGGGMGGKRRLKTALDIAMHLSLIVLLAGGTVKSLAGFVGTQYLFEGFETSTVYSPKAKGEVPLGFSLHVRERVMDYYPFVLRVGVRDAETGEKLGVLQPMEGKPASLPGGGLRLSVAAFSVEEKKLLLGIETEEGSAAEEMDLVPEGRTSAAVGGYDLSILAWRRDLKGVRGRVTVLDGGREVKEEWLAVNGRIAYRGWSIFITSWGEDEYRNPYIGAQITRDPGAPVFWSGAILLAVSLPLFLWVRHRKPASGGAGDS